MHKCLNLVVKFGAQQDFSCKKNIILGLQIYYRNLHDHVHGERNGVWIIWVVFGKLVRIFGSPVNVHNLKGRHSRKEHEQDYAEY